jgi:hypothetical protein
LRRARAALPPRRLPCGPGGVVGRGGELVSAAPGKRGRRKGNHQDRKPAAGRGSHGDKL